MSTNSFTRCKDSKKSRQCAAVSRLFPQELRRRKAGHLLEEAGEVVREFEAQEEGGFAYGMSVHQEALTLLDHEGMDVADGRSAGGFVNYVAQVAGGIGKLSGAVLDGGYAEFQLSAIQIIPPEQVVEAFEDVR